MAIPLGDMSWHDHSHLRSSGAELTAVHHPAHWAAPAALTPSADALSAKWVPCGSQPALSTLHTVLCAGAQRLLQHKHCLKVSAASLTLLMCSPFAMTQAAYGAALKVMTRKDTRKS